MVHSKQVSGVVAPIDVEYVPVPQGRHERTEGTRPTGKYVPEGHGKHDAVNEILSNAGYKPEGQIQTSVADDPPEAVEYLPDKQETVVQAVLPAALEKVPTEHGIAVPFGENVPGLLRRHWALVVTLYVLGGQTVPQDDASRYEYKPNSHWVWAVAAEPET